GAADPAGLWWVGLRRLSECPAARLYLAGLADALGVVADAALLQPPHRAPRRAARHLHGDHVLRASIGGGRLCHARPVHAVYVPPPSPTVVVAGPDRGGAGCAGDHFQA